MKTYTVIWQDNHGIQRVYGRSTNEEQAEAEAAAELADYLRGRPELKVHGWTRITQVNTEPTTTP